MLEPMNFDFFSRHRNNEGFNSISAHFGIPLNNANVKKLRAMFTQLQRHGANVMKKFEDDDDADDAEEEPQPTRPVTRSAGPSTSAAADDSQSL